MTADELFEQFGRLLGGRRGVCTVHYKTPSGEEGWRRVCNSPTRDCGPGFPDCGRCRGGGYEPLTVRAVEDHLEGRAAMGIYPVDEDGLCRFAVIELRGTDFRPRLQILAALCRENGLAHLCEMTDFGGAGRLWLFYDRPLSPLRAAEPAFDLLREAAVAVGGPPFEPWGRVWPSAAPDGGFGFPVMLPLFHREKGFSVFTDDELRPVRDETLKATVQSAPKDISTRPAKSDFPPVLRAELCDSLYIDTAGISPLGLAALCSAAGIPNSEPCRESAGYRPAFRYHAELSGRRLRLPRGVFEELKAAGLRLELVDGRRRTPAATGGISLTGGQAQSVRRILSRDFGTVSAPVGSGKTRLMCGVIAELGLSTLVLATESGAVRRWRGRISGMLGLDESAVPAITDDSVYPTGRVDVALLGPRTGFWLAEKIGEYGLVIAADVDRLHCGAEVFAEVMGGVCAGRVYAVTSRRTDSFPDGALVRLYCGPDIPGVF